MRLLKNISWSEIFAGWREREASNPGWIRAATEIKGWPDWESWRRFTASQIKAEERDWQLYAFTEPNKEIPAMLIGPHSGWQSELPLKNTLSFKEFLEIPERYEIYSRHDGVIAMLEGMPFPTQFIGLLRQDNGKVVCIEGNHRATAVALANKQSKLIDFGDTEITIALATVPAAECGLFDEVLRRGTTKDFKNN